VLPTPLTLQSDKQHRFTNGLLQPLLAGRGEVWVLELLQRQWSMLLEARATDTEKAHHKTVQYNKRNHARAANTVASEANTGASAANTTPVARTVACTNAADSFPAGAAVPWHDRQRHVRCEPQRRRLQRNAKGLVQRNL
jgi:hypothetical protein